LQSDNLSADIVANLQEKIVPLYYAHDKKEWIAMMQNARDMTINQFSATTMLRKYIEEFYLPIIRSHQLKAQL
jgi:glucan phosphorylase